MLPNTRKALNIEGHWANLSQPNIQYNAKTKMPDDNQMTQLIEKDPVPSYYNNTDYDHTNLINKDSMFKNSSNMDSHNKGGRSNSTKQNSSYNDKYQRKDKVTTKKSNSKSKISNK